MGSALCSELPWGQHCVFRASLGSALCVQSFHGVSIVCSELPWGQHCMFGASMGSALCVRNREVFCLYRLA
jgi:hypothetical protein